MAHYRASANIYANVSHDMGGHFQAAADGTAAPGTTGDEQGFIHFTAIGDGGTTLDILITDFAKPDGELPDDYGGNNNYNND